MATSTAAQTDRLKAVVEPVVAAAGFDLEGVTVTRAGNRSLLRLVIDGDSGVSLDDVANVSTAVSAVLDATDSDDVPAGSYTLEVSSPGVSRPLTLPRHWRRNEGRLVATAHVGEQLTGRIVSVDDTTVLLDVAGVQREFPVDELSAGTVQIEFDRKEG